MSHPPPSSGSFIINLIGGVVFVLVLKLGAEFYTHLDAMTLGIISAFMAFVIICFLEIVFLSVHKRPTNGLQAKSKPNPQRLSIKLVGYYGTLLCVLIGISIIPEYQKSFYSIPLLLMLFLLFIYSCLGWIYLSEMDVRMINPEDDAYYHFGNFLLGRFRIVDKKILIAHLRSVGLRAFFIVLMLLFFLNNVGLVVEGEHGTDNNSLVSAISNDSMQIFVKYVLLAYFYLAAIDTLFGLLGYIVTFKAIDCHIRSTDKTIIGWWSCMVCYMPFWDLFLMSYLFYDFFSRPEWHVWFSNNHLLLMIWAPFVILAMFMEGLTTLTFGIRFSNLTYRGLFTGGPLRFTKHPQYISKMCNRFFVYVPFMSALGFLESLYAMTMFLGICFIYYLRAKTEENHLSIYPEYVEYANWINEHGIFRWVGKILPFTKFSEEKAKAGKLF